MIGASRYCNLIIATLFKIKKGLLLETKIQKMILNIFLLFNLKLFYLFWIGLPYLKCSVDIYITCIIWSMWSKQEWSSEMNLKNILLKKI